MNWLFYILGAAVVGAVALAIYERKKNLRLRMDPHAESHDSKRAALTQAESIRAESQIIQSHTDGGMP
jgi:hypothetical protein